MAISIARKHIISHERGCLYEKKESFKEEGGKEEESSETQEEGFSKEEEINVCIQTTPRWPRGVCFFS